MAIYSNETLAARALRKLYVIQDGQNASASDLDLVTEKIEGLLSELRRLNICPAGVAPSIKPEAFDHVATLLAAMCTFEFGVTGETLARIEMRKMLAERTLRALNTPDAPIGVLKAEYF